MFMALALRTAFAAIAVFCAVGPARAEPCRADSVLGLYEGTATAKGLGEIEITLNLLCDKGQYAGQVFTSIGDLVVSSVKSANGAVALAFDTGGSLGTMELQLAGERLSGSFLVTSEKGPIDLARKGPAMAVDGMNARLDLTPQQWVDDIEALRVQLPKRHANAFFFLPKQVFELQIAALKRDVPLLNSDQIFVRMAQIVNAIGDGHTVIASPDDRRSLPIELSTFGKDIRVTAAAAGFERANGARVLKIGGMDIAAARERALTLTPAQELAELRDGRIVYYLARGLNLHGLGITPSRDRALFTLQDDAGQTFAIEFPALAAGEEPQLTYGYPKTGLRYQRPGEAFWCQDVAAAKSVYCAFHAYQDLKAKAQAMFALIDKVRPAKLIIDMRDNDGGDNTEGEAHLVKPLKARADLNRKGKLFVLIGPLTFSAAMNNAAQFQDETEATLVGQTIGEKPNSYQEPRQFRLPRSHLIVRASTLYYEFRKTGENAIRPDKEAIPTWDDMKAGRDPALDWALAQ
jgi:hypothetical protein